jgi:Protein of unknown function (DUF1302)/Acetyl-CoA dehydrogenase C-terminal like
VLAAAVICACGATGVAQAFDLDTGNDDLKARFDNTVRYNLGSRVQAQDAAILNIANADDGYRNFDKGSLVTNRLDLLSEFDLVWLRKRAVGEDAEFMRQKIAVARFYAQHLLTRVPGLRDSIVDGTGTVFAMA